MAGTTTDYKEDQLITQCAIAYINWRCNGGQGDWEPFRRQWLIENAKAAKESKNAG